MSRIRTIKPEFFTSEDIVSLSPLARLLYIATWCDADKEGRLLWKPRTFKLRYFPGDDCDVQALCDELVQSGLIVLYGDGLAYIPSFGKHQHINPRESKSTLPDPESHKELTRRDASARVTDGESTLREEGKGREGKESGDESPRAPRSSPTPCRPEGVDAQVWSDWLSLRKAKRAPVTSTVVEAAQKEASKAGLSFDAFLRVWCARGSQGLQADWLKPNEGASSSCSIDLKGVV